MPADELESIRTVIDGLLYPRESDEPFEFFSWPGSSATSAAAAIQANAGVKYQLQEVAVDQFFRELESTSDAKRFAMLRQALTTTFKDLKIYRAGEVQVQIFLIGRAPNGNWAGVRTVSVET
jgi:hypothetical protein